MIRYCRCACNNGHVSVVAALLACGTLLDVNKSEDYGTSPLWRSACTGHVDICRMLLNHPHLNVNQARAVTRNQHNGPRAGVSVRPSQCIYGLFTQCMA